MSAPPLTIIHLNHQDRGGSYEYASLLDRGLRALGHHSRLITRPAGARPWADRLARKATLAFARGPWHGAWRFLPPPPVTFPDGPSIVHLHTVGDWFNVMAWLRALPPGVRVFAGLHDLWHLSGGCFIYTSCERFTAHCRPCPLLKFPANHFLAAAEFAAKRKTYADRRVAFIANSTWLGQFARQGRISRQAPLAIVPPPIDTEAFFPQPRADCRAGLGLHPDDRVVVAGCASVTDDNKNIAGLLAILAGLSLPRLKVLLFGDGSLPVPPGLDVTFAGKMESRQKLARLYAAADVFATTSRMETYGLTLLEALACGTPVVAYRVGGIPEAVAAAPDAAHLIPPFDTAAFGRALLQTLSRQSPAGPGPDALGAAIHRRHSPAAVARLTLDFYRASLT